ncbi:MAG: hypothetical protein O6939_04160 [Bacteroidetes bacterium]|nr:hypothetical protein [Bacteroidota bacterium]
MRTRDRLHVVLCLTIGLLAIQYTAFGQTDRYLDKVVLHNGSVIWGMTEFQQEYIIIFLSEKDSLTVPVSMIKSLKTQKLNPELYLNRSQGAYYQVSWGVLLGKGHQYLENTGSFAASFAGGYKISPLIGLGLGVGLNYYPEQIHVPVYLDVQGDLLKGRLTPFYQFSAGWSWADERENISQIGEVQGGFYFRPSLGIQWHFAKHSWHLQLSYVLQKSTTRFEPVDYGNGNVITNVEDRTFQRVGISTGISF